MTSDMIPTLAKNIISVCDIEADGDNELAHALAITAAGIILDISCEKYGYDKAETRMLIVEIGRDVDERVKEAK